MTEIRVLVQFYMFWLQNLFFDKVLLKYNFWKKFYPQEYGEKHWGDKEIPGRDEAQFASDLRSYIIKEVGRINKQADEQSDSLIEENEEASPTIDNFVELKEKRKFGFLKKN